MKLPFWFQSESNGEATMIFDLRVFVFLFANGLLFYLMQLVNSALSSYSIYLILIGPMVVLPAILLKTRFIFITLVLSGLWIDSALPIPFGLMTTTFLFSASLIHLARVKIQTEQNAHAHLYAHLCNLAVFVVITLATAGAGFFAAQFWEQVIVSLAASHLILFLVFPWFYSLELLLCGYVSPVDLPDDTLTS